MRILLTGFEPFDGATINPAAEVAGRLAASPPTGVDLRTAILPVAAATSVQSAIAAFESHRPQAVVLLGLSGSATAIAIERVAVNLRDYRIADNQGTVVMDEPVVAGGPVAYFATVPVRRLLDAVRRAGVPAELSLSAGTFLCNEVLYALLHRAATVGPSAAVGFVHLPPLPEQMASLPKPRASMALDVATLGIRALLESLAESLRESSGVCSA